MKVALLTDGIFPYVIGGMQKHSYCLTKYFAKKGVRVDLYHTPFRGTVSSKIKNADCFTEDEKKYIKVFLIDFPKLNSFPGHYLRESYEYSTRVFNVFRQNTGADFIIAKGFSGWKLLEEKSKGYKCAPIGVNFHGYEMFQEAPSLRSRFEQILFLKKPVLYNTMNADYVFSYGGKITDVLLKSGVSGNNILEIPTGIERDWINESTNKVGNKRKFIFIGRFERRKGIEELNEALRELIRAHDFEFHFVGNIPEQKKVICDKLLYHGEGSDIEKLKHLLRNCDVLVCPSHSEGMPNVILEAMACGLAIIATDVGAVRLMVSEENGWLLERSESGSINSALLSAIRLPGSDLVKLKQSSIGKVKDNFLWNKIIDQTISSIEKCIVHS